MFVKNHCAFISFDINNGIDYGDFGLVNLFSRGKKYYDLGIADVVTNGGYIYCVSNAPINSWEDISWLSQPFFHAPYKFNELHRNDFNGNIDVFGILKAIHANYAMLPCFHASDLNFAFLFINEEDLVVLHDLCALKLGNKEINLIELDWWDILKHFWRSIYAYVSKTNCVLDGQSNFKLITPIKALQVSNPYPLWQFNFASDNWFEKVFNSGVLLLEHSSGISAVIFRHGKEDKIIKIYLDDFGVKNSVVKELDYFNKWEDDVLINELWIEIDKDFPIKIWQSLIRYFE